MQKLSICLGQGVRGWGQGGSKGGTWKFPKLGSTHKWLSVGGGEGGGEGGLGEAFIEVLNKTGIITCN